MHMPNLLAGAILVLGISLPAIAEVDPQHKQYQKTSGISGKLTSVGSDTLANLMTLWAEEYKRIYPGVSIQIQAAGSSTAPPALTESTSNFGPMSREMKSSEIRAFEDRFGYRPTPVPVAIDAIAVYVHRDNPVDGLSIEQVDAIFSSTRKCGALTEITNWQQLGLGGVLGASEIQLFGRNSVSGTYGYFKSVALCKGDYRNNVNEQPGSSAVVQSVTSSVNGIGYSGIGYRTAGVRTVPIAKKGSNKFFAATTANALSGSYPIARLLYVYVNKRPNQPLEPLETEFLKMVLSKSGQEIVLKDGFVPLAAVLAARYREQL